jgi:hypothetical protein
MHRAYPMRSDIATYGRQRGPVRASRLNRAGEGFKGFKELATSSIEARAPGGVADDQGNRTRLGKPRTRCCLRCAPPMRAPAVEFSGHNHNIADGFLSLRPGLFASGSGEVTFPSLRYRAIPPDDGILRTMGAIWRAGERYACRRLLGLLGHGSELRRSGRPDSDSSASLPAT